MDASPDEPVSHGSQTDRAFTALIQAARGEDRQRIRRALSTLPAPVQIVEIADRKRLGALLRDLPSGDLPDLVIAESPPGEVWLQRPESAEPSPHQPATAEAAALWILLDTDGRWLGKLTPRGVLYSLAPDRCDADDWTSLAERLAAKLESRSQPPRRDAQRQENSRLRLELESSRAQSALASRARDSLLASVSHELRTPLSAILNLSESLLEDLYGPLNAKQSRSVGLIEDNSRHLLSMINDILDLAKLEGGKLELDLAPVDLEEICLASLAHVGPTAAERRLEVSQHLSLGNRVVLGDYRRLQQILIRLLGNAIKFTPAGGKIGLDLSVAPEGQEVRLAVWDSGIGIEPTQQALLFQSFAQLDSGLDRKYVGTGLGLSLAAQMARLHGGRIQVESAGKDQGSQFTLLLPVHSSDRLPGSGPMAQNDALPMAAPASRAPLVLVAEDNETVITTVQAYLEAKGFRISTAANGLDAVQRCFEDQPDLVLMDMKMPGMNGVEAIRAIREELGDGTPPIIGLTGLDLPGEQERCIEAGADTYLRKPIRLKDLTVRIEELLAGARSPGWGSRPQSARL